MARHPDPERLARHEELFRALIQLDRAELIAHIRKTARDALPAEVLARLYHVLWTGGRRAEADAAAKRLFGAPGDDELHGVGNPEYMRWLLLAAGKRLPAGSRWHDAEDLYQSTLRQTVNALRGSQGAQAHTAWKSFCYDRMVDAQRERSRKDFSYVGMEAKDPATDRVIDLDQHAIGFPWQGSIDPDREEDLTAHVRQRIEEVEDSVTREIALDQFFGDPRSPISGKDTSGLGRPPLTERYGKTRFQIMRIVKKGEAILRRAVDEWTGYDPRR
jgi:hypothetical protein